MHARTTVRRHALALVLALPLVLAACEQKITQANFDKVTNGMNSAQVENLLGKGEDQTASGVSISYGGAADVKKSPETTMVWKGKSMTITIVFKDGKVVQKSKVN
jgi:uncharacterized lipoprotein YehR (DUF1307 family)